MSNDAFSYIPQNDAVVFTDTLRVNEPYVAEIPRNHESLFFVTDGNILYEREDAKEIVRKGQIGYIARGCSDKSSAYMCESVSYIAINFCFGTDGGLLCKTLPFEVLCSHGIAYNYEQLFKDLLNSYLMKMPGYMNICNGILMQIIGLLYNEYTTDISRLRKIRRLEPAISYLSDNYASPFTKISELAQTVNMSEKNFRRVFFDAYGKAPYAFMQEFRINKAEVLLLNTTKTITDIALQCGFCDIYSFSHCFKKHKGVSPVRYREKRG